MDLSVTKKYEGTRNGRAMWTVTVTNESDCLSSGFSLRDDVPAVNYSDVRIDAHSSGWIEGQDLVGNTVFMQHGALTAGESATLTISAERDELATTCVENQASLIGNEEDPVEDNDLAYDRSCEIQIEKTVQDQDGNGVIDGGDTRADGQDRIVYELRVTNPDPVAPHDYVLTDELNFPAWVDIACVQVQELDGQITDREVPVEGEQLPIAQSTIEAKEQHVYLVLVDYRIRPEATEENYESESQCSATDQPGGFLNTAYLESNDTVKDSTACAPIVRPEDVTLFIRKVDAQNTSQTLTDVEFEVFENIDGQPGESIAKLDSPDTANPGFFSAVLRPNIEYLLIETKSPAGYSLLPKPIEFEIRRDVDGNAVVVLGEDYRSTEIVNDLVDFEKTTHTVYIAVADFRQGDLPETGGRGVGGAIGFGIFIVLIGAVCSRRNA